MNEIDMETLGRKFSEEYDFLYEMDGKGTYVAGYDEALAFGEQMLSNQDPLLIGFVRYRQDPLTSDRELAAFAFAVTSLGLR